MLVKNYLQLQKVLQWLDSKSEVAYDLETTGLDTRKDMVIGIAIGTGTEAFYVCHQHYNSTTKGYDQFISKQMLAPLFEKLLRKRLISFNGSFDVRFTRHYFGVDLAPALWSEVQLARHTNNENDDPWVGLKAIAVSIYGAEAAQESKDLTESILKNGGQAGHVWLGDLDLVTKYAAQDALLTARLNAHYLQGVESQGLNKLYFEDEVMPLYKFVTVDLEDVGIKLDLPKIIQAQEEIQRDMLSLETQIRSLIAPYLIDFERWYLEKTVEVKRSGGFKSKNSK